MPDTLCPRCGGDLVETLHGPRCADSACRKAQRDFRVTQDFQALRLQRVQRTREIAAKTFDKIQALSLDSTHMYGALLETFEAELAMDILRLLDG